MKKQDQLTKTPHLSRMFSMAWKGLLGLLVILVVVVVGVLIFATSPGGSRFILNEVKAAIQKGPGNQFDYKSGELEILKGLHFKNLHIVRHQDGLDAVIDIDSLDIDYSFSIFQRRLQITDFEVIHPKVVLKLSAPVHQEAEQKTGQGSVSLDDLLKNPPLQLDLEKFVIQRLELDLEKAQPATAAEPANTLHAHLEGFDFALNLLLLKELLKIDGSLQMAKNLNLAIHSQMRDVTASARASGKWAFGIRRDHNNWIYEIDPLDLSILASDVVVNNKVVGAESAIKLASLSLHSKTAVRAHSKELFRADVNSVDKVAADALIQLGKLKLEAKNAKPIMLGAEKIQLKSGLADKIDIDMDYSAEGIQAEQFLSQAVGFDLRSNVQLTRDFGHMNLETRGRLQNLDLIDLKTQVDLSSPDGEVQALGDLSLNATRGLADLVRSAQPLKKMGPLHIDANFNVHRKKEGDLALQLKTTVPEILLPSLKKPAAIAVTCEASWKPVLRHLDFAGQIDFANGEFGKWKVDTKLQLKLADKATNQPLQTSGLTTIAQISRAVNGKIPVSFTKPLTVEHNVELGTQKADVEINAVIPHVDIDKFGSVDETKLKVTAHSVGLSGPKNVDLFLQLKQGRITVQERESVELLKKGASIAGLEMNIRASLKDGVRFALEEFKANFDESAVVITAQATGNTMTKDAQGQLNLSVLIPANFPEVGGQKISGRIEIPAHLALYRGREANLSGSVGLSDFSVSKTNVTLSGISGRFPFSERLNWDGKNVRFTELINENPFERVDFERVRPLLQEAEPLNIRELRWEDKTYGPFVGFFSLAQNMLYAHQFDLDLGTGHVNGEFFLDFYPANLQFGLLSRLIGINLVQVLPAKFLAKMPVGDKNVSMRSGFVLGLNHATIDGRVDITEIGGPQLVAMINVLDPNYEDEKMNKVRGLLDIGYPTSVGLKFAEGYMDMDIGLDILGLKQMENIHEIPIASMVSTATSGIVKETQKGPLR